MLPGGRGKGQEDRKAGDVLPVLDVGHLDWNLGFRG